MGTQSSSQPDVIGAGIGAAANVASTFITNSSNARENQYNRDYNLKLWNMQNAYNTPSAQMSRYLSAGLNPNLIYGSGGGSSGNASAPAASSPVHYNAPNMGLNVTQAVLQSAQADYVRQQTATEREKTGSAKAANTMATMLSYYMSQMGGDSEYKNFEGVPMRSVNAWREQDLKMQQKMQNLGLTTANRSSAQSLANLNMRLRPFNMTATDNTIARALVPNASGLSGYSTINEMLKNYFKGTPFVTEGP
jgi:hypothetical protein